MQGQRHPKEKARLDSNKKEYRTTPEIKHGLNKKNGGQDSDSKLKERE